MQLQMFNEQSLEFQEKIMERSGLGDETYLPEGQLAMSRHTQLSLVLKSLLHATAACFNACGCACACLVFVLLMQP